MKTTIFSINPKTGAPYIKVEDTRALIGNHLIRHGRNVIFQRNQSYEDVMQTILLKLCQYEYKPEKSMPSTFIILVSKCILANISKGFKTYGKNLEYPDSVRVNDNGELTYLSDESGVDDVTSEDILLAQEELDEFRDNPPKFLGGNRRGQPADKPRAWRTQQKKRKRNKK